MGGGWNMKAGDRVEWYDLFYQVREGVVIGPHGLRRARMDSGHEVLVDPCPERVFPVGTLDKTRHGRFLKELTTKQLQKPK